MQWIIPALSAGVADPSTEAGFLVLADKSGALEVVMTDEAGTELPALQVLLPRGPKQFGTRKLFAATVVATQLAPDVRYYVVLRVAGSARTVDRCRMRTWPSELGSPGSPHTAFELFLGSCYSVRTRSQAGNDLSPLTRAISGSTALPHLKVLCGDQVYLDIPVSEILPTELDALRGLLLDKYLANWASSADDPKASFGELLRMGSNLFACDDHEFWNNYPYFLTYGPQLWNPNFAQQYAATASELVQTFQCVPPTLRTFRVGRGACSVSIALLDGRYGRCKETETAHAPADLQRLATFFSAAPGPAALVLSQPLFEASALWFARTFQDRGLADMQDYGQLVSAIANCPHDVLVLSGDIHGGRIASVRRGSSAANSSAQTILEVVSSPLSLVEGGDYLTSTLDHVYPEKGKSSVASYGRIERAFGPVRENHGCRVGLSASALGVHVSVEFILNRQGTRKVGPAHPYLLR